MSLLGGLTRQRPPLTKLLSQAVDLAWPSCVSKSAYRSPLASNSFTFAVNGLPALFIESDIL